MQTESRVAQEIDDIIARAMQEYRNLRRETVNNMVAAVDTAAEESHSELSELIESTANNELPWDAAFPAEEPPIEEETPQEENTHQEIPTNSNSILVEESTSRFSSAEWFNKIQEKNVILAGLGGIGSYVAFLLGRVKINRLILFDNDIVEEGNLSGQLYGKNAIGTSKVSATINALDNMCDFRNLMAYEELYTSDSDAEDIMICGFDNMVARKTFFNNWKAHVESKSIEGRKECLFIDGRLAAESLQIFCITGDDTRNIKRYEEEFLFSDEEADATVCSYKQTSYMANMIGSLIVNLFINFCTNECSPLIPRDLPFLTEYSADTMYFKVVS